MKKLLTILVVMTVAIHATAQLTIVPKAGITLSKIAAQEEDGLDIKSTLGLTFGVGLNYAVNDMLSIQPELQYIQKGVKGEFSFDDPDFGEITGEITEHINYIELPILVKTTFGSDGLKFFLNAGPSIGFGLGGKQEVAVNFGGIKANENYKVKFGEEPDNNEGDTYYDNRIDFGLQFGGGVLIANKILIDLRYGLGLSNLMDKEDGMTSDEAKSKNRVIQFTIGLPLPIN